MEPLLWELLNSIFEDYPDRKKVSNTKNMISLLSEMHTYFDLYHETHAQLDEVSERTKIFGITMLSFYFLG